MLSEAARDEIRALTERYPEGKRKSAVMPALYVAQRELGHLSAEVLREVGELLSLAPVHVAAVATFYTMYEKEPAGKHIIDVCTNISCLLCGADDILAHLENRLGIKAGQTTADGLLTVREQECIGACSTAPALQIDYRFHENLTIERVDAILDALLAGDVPPSPEEVAHHG
jgi:NADH-quinone oxidoreductase subunit E